MNAVRSEQSAGSSALPARVAPAATDSAKLALLEELTATASLEACLERGLAWLAEHAGVHRAICLAVDPDGPRTIGVAGHGVSPALLGEFCLDLEDREHALVRLLYGSRPAHFAAGQRPPATPLERTAFHAVPLRARGANSPIAGGLLLTSAHDARLDPDVGWFAAVFAEKLERLRATRAAAGAPEDGLARDRALLYRLLNGVGDPTLYTDGEGRVIVANGRAEDLLVSRDDDTEGRRSAVAVNKLLFAAALSSRFAQQPPTRRAELLLVDPRDGSDLLFEVLLQSVSDPREGSCVVSVLRNVTDLGRAAADLEESYRRLRQAEAEVRAERHRLHLILDALPDPVVVVDPVGDVVLTNDHADRLFSVPPQGGKEAQRWVTANDARFFSFVCHLLVAGTDRRHRAEIQLVDPGSGQPVPVEAVAGKIQSEHGDLDAVVTVLHDRRAALARERTLEEVRATAGRLEGRVADLLADLSRREDLLRQQEAQIDQAAALKAQFLANVSHELRTPLNAVLGYTQMMLQGVAGALNPGQKKYVSRIDSNSRHLVTVVDEILDITRIEAGRMPVEVTEVGLVDVVTEVLAELDPTICRSGLEVRSRIPDGFPTMATDRAKLKQILLNLVGNALKFTHEGRIDVTARHRPKSGMVSVAVSDTGIGIAREHHEKIFEDFRQVDASPARAYGGTGLGLSICRRLANLLDGRITLDSELGRGSTFTLHLPRRLDPAAARMR